MSLEIKNKAQEDKSLRRKDISKLDTTLKGVLVDNHLQYLTNSKITFNDIEDSLLINNSKRYYSYEKLKQEKESAFDPQQVLKPLLAGTLGIMGGCFALSACVKKSSDKLLKTKSFEHLPDLAINMNIREEPQFAIYRAIRDPSFRNIAGAFFVFLMSGITLAGKNFIDGTKEVWLKKKNADIEKNLQENLISVERDAFSGKLKVVNDMMRENVKYFDEVINTTSEITSFKNDKRLFKSFQTTSFKRKEDKSNNQKEKNMKYIAFSLSVAAICFILGKLSYSNLKNTMKNAKSFADNYTNDAIGAIDKLSNKKNKSEIQTVIELMKSICAKPEYIKKICSKYDLSEKEIQQIIEEVEKSKKTIFSDAPTALGGVPKKIQYYCYIDEPRGHLYNWILNPENKFTKYIFQAFTISGAIGYIFTQGMDAIKQAAVMQENAKTDLDLKKRLVSIEIESFRAKKESAINPLIDDFSKQAKEGKKSKKELKQLADNILMEIKNGPPYVYN